MKKYLAIIIFAVFLFSCGNEKTLMNREEQLIECFETSSNNIINKNSTTLQTDIAYGQHFNFVYIDAKKDYSQFSRNYKKIYQDIDSAKKTTQSLDSLFYSALLNRFTNIDTTSIFILYRRRHKECIELVPENQFIYKNFASLSCRNKNLKLSYLKANISLLDMKIVSCVVNHYDNSGEDRFDIVTSKTPGIIKKGDLFTAKIYPAIGVYWHRFAINGKKLNYRDTTNGGHFTMDFASPALEFRLKPPKNTNTGSVKIEHFYIYDPDTTFIHTYEIID